MGHDDRVLVDLDGAERVPAALATPTAGRGRGAALDDENLAVADFWKAVARTGRVGTVQMPTENQIDAQPLEASQGGFGAECGVPLPLDVGGGSEVVMRDDDLDRAGKRGGKGLGGQVRAAQARTRPSVMSQPGSRGIECDDRGIVAGQRRVELAEKCVFDTDRRGP